MMKKTILLLLLSFFAFSAFAQKENPLKQYLKKVKSPIYLDGQAGLFIVEFDFAAFHSLSGGFQLTRSIGFGMDYMKGDSGNSYDHTNFTGTGLQFRFTKPHFIGRFSYGIINNGGRFDDSWLEYQYEAGKDNYFRLDAGYRFWKVLSIGISAYFTQNINFSIYEPDYNTDNLVYLEHGTQNTKGFTITLGLLLPPF